MPVPPRRESPSDSLTAPVVTKKRDAACSTGVIYFIPIADGRTVTLRTDVGAVTPEFEAAVKGFSERCCAASERQATPRPQLLA